MPLYEFGAERLSPAGGVDGPAAVYRCRAAK